MKNVLAVAAFEIGNPVLLIILVERHDFSHCHRRTHYCKPNANKVEPAAMTTYCLPSTAYVIGDE